MATFVSSTVEQASARYTFKAEWRDVENCIVTEFVLSYFIHDGSIELFDVKKRRIFLKKFSCSNVSLEDLFVGNIVNIMSRQIHITDYGDNFTKQQMKTRMQRTFGIIKPEQVDNLGKLIDLIQQEGFTIGNMRTARVSNDQGLGIFASLKGTAEQGLHVNHLTSGPVVCLELRGECALKHWIEFVGPADPEDARKKSPGSLRARFGRDIIQNGFHCAEDDHEVDRLVQQFFNTKDISQTATFTECTCCVIKPHAVHDGLTGKIIEAIKESEFKITALKMVTFDSTTAEEFLEIYRDIVPEYAAMVTQFSSGPCIALEVIGRGSRTPTEFRELAGPSNPDIARKLRPHTLRAKYGKDKICNAVHCTDLPEDGLLEVEYFFKLL